MRRDTTPSGEALQLDASALPHDIFDAQRVVYDVLAVKLPSRRYVVS